MFKNLTLFRITPSGRQLTAAQIEERLGSIPFVPCGELQAESMGFAPPVKGHSNMVVSVQGQVMGTLMIETKILPPSAIEIETDKRVAAIENEAGASRVSGAQRREIKAQVGTELLAKALPRRKRVAFWISLTDGWLGLDLTSPKAAEEMAELIGTALMLPLETPPFRAWRCVNAPSQLITGLLLGGETPGITLDGDVELVGHEGDSVRYKKIHLTDERIAEIKGHLLEAKTPRAASMTWKKSDPEGDAEPLICSFTLTGSYQIKGIALDGNPAGTSSGDSEDLYAEAQAQLLCAAGVLCPALAALTEALGGESAHEEDAPAPTQGAAADEGDESESDHDHAPNVTPMHRRTEPVPQFQHPSNSALRWSGRGRKPAWAEGVELVRITPEPARSPA